MKTDFRGEINALRALAVVAVLLFHFSPQWLPGGFAGVDVFFVISGYLMTRIIMTAIEANAFSFRRFYGARARRIIPALAVLCIALLLVSFVFLTPQEYKTLSKHVFSSMGFFSNFVYWSEVGYFDIAAHQKWLLHTWSLSVEWQFYLLYPIALTVLARFIQPERLGRILLLATLVGLLLSIHISDRWPNAAYYLLTSRAWELFLGGLAYFYPWRLLPDKSRLLELFGLALIIGSFYWLSGNIPWPGYMALFPVFGSFLVIQANNSTGWLAHNRALQGIGAWSYSIYLWHWPLLVAYGYFNWPAQVIVPLILTSLLLGYLSFRFVERNRHIPIWTVYLILAALLLPIHYFGDELYGVPDDLWNAVNIEADDEEYGGYTWINLQKFSKSPGFSNDRQKILIIGDSQAADWANVLVEMGADHRFSIVSRIVPAKCGVFFISGDLLQAYLDISDDIRAGNIRADKCRQAINNVSKGGVIEAADFIILAMNWRPKALPYVAQSIENIFAISEAQVIVMGAKGFDAAVPKLMYQHHSSGSEDSFEHYLHGHQSDSVLELNKTLGIMTNDLGIRFLNPVHAFCGLHNCTAVGQNRKPYFYDRIHLSREGAAYLARWLCQAGIKELTNDLPFCHNVSGRSK